MQEMGKIFSFIRKNSVVSSDKRIYKRSCFGKHKSFGLVNLGSYFLRFIIAVAKVNPLAIYIIVHVLYHAYDQWHYI